MPSLMSGISTALQAVLAHQQSVQVIEHNVANANTPGYHRQSAVLTAGIPTSFSNLLGFYAGEMGTGVTVDKIKRYNMEFFDQRYRGQVGEASRWSLESGLLKQVEATLDETGEGGMINKLDSFWASWQNLSVDPSNTALRSNLVAVTNELTQAFQGRNAQLNQLRIDQNLEIVQRAEEINTIGEQVAQLNVEIMHVINTNQQPNDLMDKRDLLLDRLSELSGARADMQPTGMVNVSIGGHTLVNGSESSKIAITQTTLTANLAWDDGDTFDPQSGELAGLKDLRDNVLPGYQSNLDKLAYNLVTQVNQLHNPGGVAGQDFFNALAGQTGAAGLITLNPAMNTLSNIMGTATLSEDGSIAKSISDLAHVAVAGLGNITLNEFYTQKASELGLFSRQADTYARDRNTVIKSLSEQRESIEGVSLDEEATNLVAAQKSFEAATRLVNTIDDMLDRIINGMGLVGR